MSQMKEQNKTTEKELNKMEAGNLLDTRFKTLVIRMLNEHRGTVGEIRTSTAKHRAWKPLKKKQSEMKDTLIKIE